MAACSCRTHCAGCGADSGTDFGLTVPVYVRPSDVDGRLKERPTAVQQGMMGEMPHQDRFVEAYYRVRGLPYDTAAAYDAPGLRAQGRGNCVAKADLLADELSGLGATCRIVCWEYELPALVEVQRDLAFASDIHTTVQVRMEDRWILVDATHDPALANLGLTVGWWDGETDTEPAYPAVGPVVALDRHGNAPQLDRAMERIAWQVENTHPDLIATYQRDLNLLFEQARS